MKTIKKCCLCLKECTRGYLELRIPQGTSLENHWPHFFNQIHDDRKKENGNYPLYFHSDCMIKLDRAEGDVVIDLLNGMPFILTVV